MKSATDTITISPTKHDPSLLAVGYANGETAFIYENGMISSIPKNSTAVQYWDWKDGRLTVQYQSSTDYYYYMGVPMTVVWELMLAESVGAFIAKRVKPNYPVTAVSLL